MLRNARLALFLLCMTAALAQSGCLSFRSATALGSVGQLVGQRSVSIKIMPFFCDAQNVLAGPVPTCPRDQIQAYVDEITKYSQSVAKYASGLRRLAEFNDEGFGDELSDAITGVDKLNQAAGMTDAAGVSLSTAASSLGAVLTQEWRRNKLEELVRRSHPPLIQLLDGLLGRTALLTESVKALAEQDLAFRRRALAEIDRLPAPPRPPGQSPPRPPGPPGPPPAVDLAARQQRQAVQLGLLQFEWFTQQAYDNLVNYQKALLAFKQGHLIVYRSVTTSRSLSDNDQEIYDLLKKDLPKILK